MHCVDLGESFPTSIYLQKSAAIQPRTSPSKFRVKFNSIFIRLLIHRPKRPAVVKPKQQIPALTRSPTSGAERMRKMVNINPDKLKPGANKFRESQSRLTKQMSKLESPQAGFWATDLTSPGGVKE